LPSIAYAPNTSTDAATRSIAILGELDGQVSLLIMEKTPFPQDFPSRLGFQQIQTIEINDIVGNLHEIPGLFLNINSITTSEDGY
jgi:Scavenger mRNA decapping enzyme (DcpS) N-terminal